jgi:hypothetical protein
MLDGRAHEQQRQTRQIASWMSPLLTALTGHSITPGQLLGEEAPEASGELTMNQKIKAGQKKVAATLRKLVKLNQRKKDTEG